jgi:ribosomal-protein-alanine N-acetyltransferase
MQFQFDHFQMRPFRPSDAPSLAMHANNIKIWRNVRDAFPHPYTEEDAQGFIERALEFHPLRHFAIVIDGAVCGGTGIHPQDDIYSHVAEVGYWVSEVHWGKGIMSKALNQLVEYGFEELDIQKVIARIYSSNKASARVAEKAGFVLEAVLKGEVIKQGTLMDEHRYARWRER